jgi:hypothetical protein
LNIPIENGFIRASLVRARMLHQFLWQWLFGGGVESQPFDQNIFFQSESQNNSQQDCLSLSKSTSTKHNKSNEKPLVTSLAGLTRMQVSDSQSLPQEYKLSIEPSSEDPFIDTNEEESKTFDFQEMVSLYDIPHSLQSLHISL